MRALILGAGRMGAHHARVARSLGIEAMTVDPRRAADFRAIEAAPAAEIAVVATPIDQLAETACAAIRAGCERVLVEKPLARTVADAQALIRLAQDAQIVLLVGYTERFNPLVQLVRDDLLPRAGAVRALRFERQGPAPADPSFGPGIDLAVHDIDLLRFLGFEPRLTSGTSTPDVFEATLECGGPRAELTARYADGPRIRRFWIDGALASVECDLVRQSAHVVTTAGVSTHTAPGDEPLRGQWLALLEGTGPTGADGLAALSLALALDEPAPVSD